ncbi:hypothetical protein GMMP15_90036 [Candidatus Magnetomoraceae bacterium gMMP-15]
MMNNEEVKQIKTYVKSVGKTEKRNDDFVYALNISNTRAIGVLGDFTSDSRRDLNKQCLTAVKYFIEEELPKWKFNLTPGPEIIKDVANYINKWLKDSGTTYDRTTLIVILYDSYENKLYYTIKGDSGLAIIEKNSFEYIYQGDTSGIRNAAGFLPITDEFNVETKEISSSDIIFAYTDGLWENTNFADNDNQLKEIFRKNTLNEIKKEIDNKIFKRSYRKDDLSILILKEEQMSGQVNNKSDNGFQKELLDKFHSMKKNMNNRMNDIEDKIEDFQKDFELINKKSPIEEELVEELEKLQDEVNGLKSIENKFINEVREIKDSFKTEFKKQNERLINTFTEIKDRLEKIETAREIKSDSHAEKYKKQQDRDNNVDTQPVTSNSTSFKKHKNNDQTNKKSLSNKRRDMRDKLMDIVAIGFIVIIVMIIFFISYKIYRLIVPNNNSSHQEVVIKKEGSNNNQQQIKNKSQKKSKKEEDKQVPSGSMNQSVNQNDTANQPNSYTGIQNDTENHKDISNNLKALFDTMNVDNEIFLSETQCLTTTLTTEKEKINQANQKITLPYSNNCKILNDSLVSIKKQPWMVEDHLDSNRIYKMWLQIRIGADVDGKPGTGTKETFLKTYKKEKDAEKIYDKIIAEWQK